MRLTQVPLDVSFSVPYGGMLFLKRFETQESNRMHGQYYIVHGFLAKNLTMSGKDGIEKSV